MCNSFRITFMFKKSVAFSGPDHLFVDWCKLRKWSSQKSSGMLGITANGWMHSLTEYTLSSNKPNIAVRTVQTFDNKSWTTTGQLDAECWLTFCCPPCWITFYFGSPEFLAMPLISCRYKPISLGSSRHVSTRSMCRECRAMLFNKLDTAKTHGLGTSNVSSRVETWRDEPRGILAIVCAVNSIDTSNIQILFMSFTALMHVVQKMHVTRTVNKL